MSGDAMEPLAFAVMAGLTPPGIEISFFDERVEELPLDETADLVALSVDTFSACRAYAVADHFRSRRIPVVMGGPHPTVCVDEALTHADSVVVGEAESVWPQIVSDAASGRLESVYRSEKQISLEGIRFDRAIFKGKPYSSIRLVQFGRGCPYTCDFCSIRSIYGKRVRTRPVADVVEEIQSLNPRYLFFVDDNLMGNREAAADLLRAIIPLRLKWACQASLDMVCDPELLDLMEESGCVMVLVGLESLHAANLHQMGKASNLSSEARDMAAVYEDAIQQLHRRGIMIYGTFVFGYNDDTKSTIQRTLEFAIRNRLFLANFNPLMAMPGTRLYDRLRRQTELISTFWWLDPDFQYGDAMFCPNHLTAAELKSSCFQARRRFNRLSCILSRAFRQPNRRHFSLTLMANMISRREIYRKQGLSLGGPS